MTTFQVLDPSTNIHRHLFIEASAGTGKTFTIQQLVARRLLEKEPLEPHQIAVITFTRAVAGEVRSRIEETFIKLRKESSPVDKVHLQQIQRDLPQIEINTLHGFCRRLLQDFSTRELSEVEWVSEERLFEIVTEILQRGIGLDVVSPAGLKALRHVNRCNDRQLVAQLLKQPSYPELPTSRYELISELKRAVASGNFKGVQAGLREYADFFTGVKTRGKELKDGVRRFIDYYAMLFDDAGSDGTGFEAAIAHFEATGETIRSIFSNLKQGANLSSAFPNNALVQRLIRDVDPKLEMLIAPAKQLVRLRWHIHMHLKRLSSLHGWLTPDMLIQEVEELARRDQQFVDKVRARYHCIVIDEFQDTDPLQWSIVSTLFLHENWGGFLYLVGDPKQAMYSFRSADVYSYMAAREMIKEHETLNINYRASKQMIAGFNHLFTGPISERLFYLPAKDQALEIPTILGGFESCSPAIEIALFYGRLGKKRTWPDQQVEQEKIFPWVVEQILHLQSKSVPLNKIAILVRDRHQSERIRLFLQEFEVEANIVRSNAQLGSEAALLLLAFFSLLRAPKEVKQLKRFISILPYCEGREALIDDDLELIGALLEPFQQLANEYRCTGALVSFGRFLKEVCSLNGRRYDNLLRNQTDCEELFWEIEAIFDTLSDDMSVDLYSLDQVVQFLEGLYEAPEKREVESRFDPSNNGVVIMTMHKSKGLEFENVIALGIASRTPASYSNREIQKLDELDAEKSRLLYVACTRAKERLFIPVPIDLDGKKIAIGSASPMELLLSAYLQARNSLSLKEGFLKRAENITPKLLEEACGGLLNPEMTISVGCPVVRSIKIPQKRERERSKGGIYPAPNWKPLQRSSFSAQHQHTLSSSASSDASGGRMVGIEFHKKMEVSLRKREVAAEIAAIEIPYHGVRRPLRNFLGWHILTEVPFSYMKASQEVSGVIDALLYNDTEVFAIDWKTHAVDGLNREELFEETIERLGCRLQGLIYKEAINRWSMQEITFLGVHFIFVPQGDIERGYEIFSYS